MKETTAFTLVRKLKADGHSVAIEDQPKICRQAMRPDEFYAAVTGAADMTDEGVKACTDAIRSALIREGAPYTIERRGDKNRLFPKSSFAAW